MLPSSLLVSLHIMAAVIGILAGVLAMVARKGSGVHNAAGDVFVIAILVMSGTAWYLAAFVKWQPMNIVASTLMAYLVSTGWRAGRRKRLDANAFDAIAMMIVAGTAIIAITLGAGVASGRLPRMNGVPPAPYFVFGTSALLFALGDARFLTRRMIAGAARLRRHVVRMSVALLVALLSFFPGQAKQLPETLRHNSMLYIPHVIVAGVMFLWLARLRARRREASITLRTERSSYVEPISAAAVR